jgi:hypothetical protein
VLKKKDKKREEKEGKKEKRLKYDTFL